MRRHLTVFTLVLLSAIATLQAAETTVEVQKGERICLLGGALAERMQHDGWLETLVQSRFPQHELVFRNLGFAADALFIRQRVDGFGTPEDWLTRCKADTIFAFFGFNESFDGEVGLPKFKGELEAFIKQMREKNFNGKNPPKLVLFSPIAFENLKTRDLPEGSKQNANLNLYSQAMAEVARAQNVPFVNLFNPSQELYNQSRQPLTINSIHLNTLGNQLVAETIDAALFGKRKLDYRALEKLRQAVLDKNFHWYSRYRPTDDYNIFGGRSDLKYTENLSNREVLMREMEILEVQSANRDKRIWSVAQGGDAKVDDSNTPPHIHVRTNKPGANPDGSHVYLSGEKAIEKMTVAKDMKVNLFASEEMFPELANPVQMAFDTKGRLWAAAWPTYPHWQPQSPMNDKLLIFEDTDNDGKADKCITFADDLHDPTGFEFYNGGVLIAIAPDLIFLKDTDGDDKADYRVRVLHGISSGDSHHAANSFSFDPGGALYFAEGVFHRTQIESPYGPVRNTDACMWRFEPRTWKIERYIAYGFANPHGNVFDAWGNHYMHDGTGANPYHAALFSGHLDAPHKHPSPPGLYKQRTRPCPGTEILTSRHFPDEMQGNLLVGNVIGFQGILQYKLAPEGASFAGTETEVILSSSDPNFRPSDFEMGPDGAIYFTDWHQAIIGHMQHHIRDPNRDHAHGRIYRITYPSRPLLKPAKIAGEPIKKLLELLKEPENRTRYRARLELSAHESDKVISAVTKWVKNLDKKDPNYEHQLTEALWLHQFHNIVNEELLKRLLRSPNHNARAAATRVLCYWREQVAEPLALLRTQADDEHPLVRLEAVRACSFFKDEQAADVALLLKKHPMDNYLTYTFGETMRQLEPLWTAALTKGVIFARGNPAGAAYILDKVGTPELLKMERSEAVYSALLSRHGIDEKYRNEALEALAKQSNSTVTTELLNAMERVEKSAGGHIAHVLGDLAQILFKRPAAELAAAAPRVKAFAASGKSSALRATAYAIWITADGNDNGAFAQAAASVAGLSDYLAGVQMINDAKLLGMLYPRIRPLMFTLPDELLAALHGKPAGPPGIHVAYHQFGPPNAARETFEARKPEKTGIVDKFSLDIPQVLRRDAFALVFSGMLVVPKSGRYTFFLSSDDGSRLYLEKKLVIDNDGLHGMSEKTASLDLSAGTHPIVVTYFDNGGGDGLEVAWSGPGFDKKPIAGAALSMEESNSVGAEAIRAVSRTPGNEAEKFNDFAKLINDSKRSAAAVAALRALPKQQWPADQAPRVIDTILAYLTSLPASERTTAGVVDALNLGKEMAALLPPDKSGPLLARLQTLNVDIVVIRPIPHQMMFDHKRFVVEAGKPVELIFDNTDLMPHNLVITAPGTMTEVGQAAEQMGAAGEAKQYIPDTKNVLWYTKLVLPGQSQRLSFTAPTEPGEYPFVCTFPGHYLVMNGIMEVAKDKATARPAEKTVHADTPQRPFVKMWEMKDLEGDLAHLDKGRSLARGKTLFTAAGCIKCHTIDGQGAKVGPDLSEVTKKYKGKALLQQILEPSTEINEQFRTFLFATKDGKRVSGLIIKEDEQNLEISTNPLADAVTRIAKADVQSKKPLTLSSMPTGMLVTLNKDEILDLLAYIEAGGKVGK